MSQPWNVITNRAGNFCIVVEREGVNYNLEEPRPEIFDADEWSAVQTHCFSGLREGVIESSLYGHIRYGGVDYSWDLICPKSELSKKERDSGVYTYYFDLPEEVRNAIRWARLMLHIDEPRDDL